MKEIDKPKGETLKDEDTINQINVSWNFGDKLN